MCVGELRSFPFYIRAGVRQGGVLSPVLFAIYIDVLVSRLRSVNIGCKLLDVYFGCLLYADDIVILAHSLNGIYYFRSGPQLPSQMYV